LLPNFPLVFLKIQVWARDIHLMTVPVDGALSRSTCLGLSGLGFSVMWKP
jgi:hypothetical protein